jgi:oxygen-independent coproporphyrinogen III oxidase
VSNYSREGYRCRHNENYWRNGEYVGLGAGATSYVNGFRLKSEPDPPQWMRRVLAGLPPALVQKEAMDDHQQAVEVLMLALRTSDGLNLPAFCSQFDLDLRRYEMRVKALVEAGLADWDGRRLALTPVEGFLLHSEIVQMFM